MENGGNIVFSMLMKYIDNIAEQEPKQIVYRLYNRYICRILNDLRIAKTYSMDDRTFFGSLDLDNCGLGDLKEHVSEGGYSIAKKRLNKQYHTASIPLAKASEVLVQDEQAC